MKLQELFKLIDLTAKEIKASKPFLVGGFVRDVVIGNYKNIKDVDLTCGDSSSDKLGQAVLEKIPKAVYTKFSDGHGCLSFDDFKVDFSNNFNVDNIDVLLKQKGIVKPTNLEREVYSRDFTINTLLMPLDLSKIYDLTKRGVKDIKLKTIDTCLEPEITLSSDPRRIVRIVYLGAKLGFLPSKRIIDWTKANINYVKDIDSGYFDDKINKAMEKNSHITIEIINLLGLSSFVSTTNKYTEAIGNDPELLFKALNG